ncbi:MAG TPA: NPCBM/NEW2 domain-containing protein [Gaiellaceae bacterium]|nr:NPCBM/NEW2 domain-containing protein [Gaiellaceae bacterium]
MDIPGEHLRATAAGELSTDPIVSNGVTHNHPVALDAGCYNAWGGDAWVDYVLGTRYELFTATVGLPDSARAGSTASFRVLGDGKTLASGNLVPGSSTKIKLSLSGISRLRLFSNVPGPTGAAGCGNYFLQVVFGDAQVLGP